MESHDQNLGHGALAAGLSEAGRLLQGFYDGLDDRRVAPGTPLEDVIHAFASTLGEGGVGVDGALRDVERCVLPHAMSIPHPLYLGLINSSPLPGGIVAESIVSGLNNNAGSWEQSPPLSAAEEEVKRCFIELLGLDPASSGIVLPGGSYTTLHAMQLAREAKLPGWSANGARSLAGDPRVYVSDASHFSAARAAIAVGVSPKDVVPVPTRGRGAIDPQALRLALEGDRAAGRLPFALVATLGTTGTGAMDPLPELIEIAREFDLWLHVDACYGGAAALLGELRPRFEGLAEADSVSVDPHKWFFVPIAAGLLFTRHPSVELAAFDVDASYIPRGQRTDPFLRGLPTSRRGAGFTIWMAIRAHGLSAIRGEVRRNISLARQLEEALGARGFRVMDGGELSIVCARWEPVDRTDAECEALQKELAQATVRSGKAWFGTVRAQGQSWLRFTLVSTFTRPRHVEAFADHLLGLAEKLPATRPVP